MQQCLFRHRRKPIVVFWKRKVVPRKRPEIAEIAVGKAASNGKIINLLKIQLMVVITLVTPHVVLANPLEAHLALLHGEQVDLAVLGVVLGTKGFAVVTPLAPLHVLPEALHRLEVALETFRTSSL